ncbi:MAG: hypothetical protein ACOYUZ_01610 [Patescibacteria group bacterium]
MNVAENIGVAQSLVPAVRTADAEGTGVDTMGFDELVAVIDVGALDLTTGDETYTVKLQEGATSTPTTDITGASVSITAASTQKLIRVKGLGTGSRLRYIRAYLDVDGTTPSIALNVTFIMGGAKWNPPESLDADV